MPKRAAKLSLELPPEPAPEAPAAPAASRQKSRQGLKAITIWAPPDLARQIKVRAAEVGRPREALILEAIRDMLANPYKAP